MAMEEFQLNQPGIPPNSARFEGLKTCQLRQVNYSPENEGMSPENSNGWLEDGLTILK